MISRPPKSAPNWWKRGFCIIVGVIVVVSILGLCLMGTLLTVFNRAPIQHPNDYGYVPSSYNPTATATATPTPEPIYDCRFTTADKRICSFLGGSGGSLSWKVSCDSGTISLHLTVEGQPGENVTIKLSGYQSSNSILKNGMWKMGGGKEWIVSPVNPGLLTVQLIAEGQTPITGTLQISCFGG